MRFTAKTALGLVLNRVVRIGPFHFFYADRKERLQIQLANKPQNRSLLTAEERKLLRTPRKLKVNTNTFNERISRAEKS